MRIKNASFTKKLKKIKKIISSNYGLNLTKSLTMHFLEKNNLNLSNYAPKFQSCLISLIFTVNAISYPLTMHRTLIWIQQMLI